MTSTRRRWIFAAVAVAAAVFAATATLLAVDVYLHGRYERSAGFNVWGYRGQPIGKKKPREYRIAVLGGSSVYGYGVPSDQAMPAVLARLLSEHTTSTAFTVVNLGYNNEGAYSFKPTLIDYTSLRPDLVLLYEGYNDLSAGGQTNVSVFRHDSPIFRLTGYMPIFPIIFKEKAAAMLNGGDTGALYRTSPGKTVFHTSLATKAEAGALQATANIAKSLEAELGRVSTEPGHRVDGGEATGCPATWQTYCQSISLAVEFARQRGLQVIVVTQPYLSSGPKIHARHVEQQEAMRAMLQRRFASDPDVRSVDLGDRIDLENALLSFDHLHLTALGNAQLAGDLVAPVLEMAARRKQKTS